MDTLREFVRESNKIEGILRDPTDAEVEATEKFIMLDEISIGDLIKLVSVYQPGAELRDRHGMDVMVGSYFPPSGGPALADMLDDLLSEITHMTPWEAHKKYESIHPFTDGNGRSGRALWLWHMGQFNDSVGVPVLGFLHSFYYQTLDESW